jgi:hypothetical protein
MLDEWWKEFRMLRPYLHLCYNPFMLRWYRSILLTLIFLCFTARAIAQDDDPTPSATLSRPDIGLFPTIQVFLDVRDDQGRFIHNLQPSDITIFENTVAIPASGLEEIRPGVQAVVVINPGPPFALRNSQAIARYDLLLEALNNWFKNRQGSTIDDWSLLVNNGPRILHGNDPMEIYEALQGVNVEVRDSIPNLDSAFQAVELAADQPPRNGMGRAVFFITPPLDETYAQSLDNLTSRAQELGVRFFIWMVGLDDNSTRLSIERLQSMAQATQGDFAIFSAEEAHPDPEQYFEPLRETYIVSYPSQIRTSGTHQLQPEVITEQGTIIGSILNFELNIQNPVPAFIQPPTTIVRTLPDEAENTEAEADSPTSYQPESQQLEILVDFPDGMVRPLQRSALFIDGTLVEEHLQEPFHRFMWDLTAYTTSADHNLRVDVLDSFGLSGSSVETRVLVAVEQPVSTIRAFINRNLPILAGAIIIMAGAILFLVLILGGKLRPRRPGTTRSPRRQPERALIATPPPQKPESQASWTSRIQWPHLYTAGRTYAFLTPLEATRPIAEPISTLDASSARLFRSQHPPIPVNATELTIGSDPAQASILLTDPSVESLHARLLRQEDGAFRLLDEDSTAGTWINYKIVPKEGAPLFHGDLVHIGRSGFRFTLRHPDRVRKPVVIPTFQGTDQPQANGSQPPDNHGMTPK